ncbi:MAG: L,D-transpeptidase family protein [Hyphomicrobiales bacterium]
MMKKLLSTILGVVLALTLSYGFAEARQMKRPAAAVRVHVDIGSQTMSVNVNGMPYGYWRVSTARPGYHTPRGTYRVTRTAKVYFSRKYDNSPMPNSVFFYGGYAIHGTYHVKNLGRPASHGCVRLAPQNAARLYSLVQRYGSRSTVITLTD